jgi:hypothetical protein
MLARVMSLEVIAEHFRSTYWNPVRRLPANLSSCGLESRDLPEMQASRLIGGSIIETGWESLTVRWIAVIG